MSEPFWTPLGGQPVDYEGAWNPATQYAPGDVVTYNGVTYLAVNPSLGSTPSPAAVASGMGTSFPATPVDGQVFVLVDSLTAPTYSWQFQYVAAKATNKWVFIGGSPYMSAVIAAMESTGSATYVALTTPGPSITVPVAGRYVVLLGHGHGLGNEGYMSYDIGGTAAVDADAVMKYAYQGSWREKIKDLAAVTLTAKYRAASGTPQFGERVIGLVPVAVGG